ncbi:MAG: MlaD family protein [Bacteroidia bacterium]
MKFKKEIQVGFFVLIGILLLILGYNFLKGFNPIKGYNKYYVVYDNVAGLVKSTQVTINGLKVGQVENIGLHSRGDVSRILVTLIVIDDVQLPVGTQALITSQDLLGTKNVDIRLAQDQGKYLNSGDTLVGIGEESLTSSISKLVSPIKEKSEQVLVTLDKILMSMNDVFDSTGTRRLASGINDLSWSIHNVRNITERFDQLTAQEYDRIKTMMNNMGSIVQNIRNNNEIISRSLKNIASISDTIVAADLTGTISYTSKVMKEFSTSIEKINRGEGSLGKLVKDDQLYMHIDQASKSLDSLLTDMQNYPARYFTISAIGSGSRAKKADKKRADDIKKRNKKG